MKEHLLETNCQCLVEITWKNNPARISPKFFQICQTVSSASSREKQQQLEIRVSFSLTPCTERSFENGSLFSFRCSESLDEYN